VEDLERQTVPVLNFFTTGDPSIDMVTGQRLAAMMAIGQLDILFLDEASVRGMAGDGMIIPVDNMLASAYASDGGLQEKIERAGGVLYAEYVPGEEFTDTEEGDGTDPPEANGENFHAYGIPISGSPLYTDNGFVSGGLYFCLAATTEKESRAAEALIYFYE
jgi:hypothetical protein